MEQPPIKIHVTDHGSQHTYHAEWSTRKRGLLAQIVGGVISLIIGIAVLAFVFWLALFLFAVGAIVLLAGIRFKWHQRKFHAAAAEFERDYQSTRIEDAVVVEESEDV